MPGTSALKPETLAKDEVQASARARSEPVPLLHPWEGSGAAGERAVGTPTLVPKREPGSFVWHPLTGTHHRTTLLRHTRRRSAAKSLLSATRVQSRVRHTGHRSSPRWPRAWRSCGAAAAAIAAFRRSGDPHLLESAVAPDLRFRMAGRVERRGRDYFATRLAHDFEYGVTGRPLRVIPGEQSRSPNCCSTARPSSRSLPARRLRRPTSFPLT
jgi:hypothetical protein